MRFGKRIKIPPGVHINLSGFGASVSLGPRGASVTVGKNGDFGNVSIPDTGLYPRQRLRGGKGNTSSQSKDKGASSFEVAATFRGDGAIAFSDTQDQPLPMELEKLFQNENSETVRVWMEPL
ncbi:MAG: DUF4236 domain-containing protein [Chromatiaceae bacterium]|nr:DUF4236 domain-containing protein [Chromatiaceae bacterium]